MENSYFEDKGEFLDTLLQYQKYQTLGPCSKTSLVIDTDLHISKNSPSTEVPEFSGKCADWIKFRDWFLTEMDCVKTL